MKNGIIAIMAMVAVGCTPIPVPKTPSAEGFAAIRFSKLVAVRDHGINIYQFSAGQVLVSDRVGVDERPLYCGIGIVNSQPLQVCVGYEAPNILVLGPGAGFREVKRPVEAGSIRQIKVKP